MDVGHVKAKWLFEQTVLYVDLCEYSRIWCSGSFAPGDSFNNVNIRYRLINSYHHNSYRFCSMDSSTTYIANLNIVDPHHPHWPTAWHFIQ